MTDKQTGGPAYFIDKHAVSMTLRDYFAAKALQGVLASDNLQTVNFEKIADDSYRMADAMLKAREA